MFPPMIGAFRFLSLLVWAFLAVPLLTLHTAAGAASVIHVGQLQLSGAQEENGVASFRGIAYARPPIGKLRWMAPRQPAPRRGKVDATRFAPACPQGDGNTKWYRNVAQAMGSDPSTVKDVALVSEDCLYLNVWTPDPRPAGHGRGMPVMVWIHGGSNANGYSHEPNYLGSHLAKQGVVVVSINYRVGLMGFFAHPALGADASGKQGLLDQLAALKWVSANIASFGGDPSQITLFGESAGGTDIALLATMPKAKGLFARAIIQSGYLPGDSVMTRGEAEKLATGLFDSRETAASLRAMPWQDIISLQQQKLAGHFYAPVAEWPRRLSVPLLIGSNANEYLMYLRKDQAWREAELAAELASVSLERRSKLIALLNELRGGLPGQLDALSAGKAFHCPSMQLASATAETGQHVFVYHFDRVRPGNHGLGAYHGAEIPYIFDTSDVWLPGDESDRKLGPAMQRYWVNFARTGDPNGPELAVWPQWRDPYQALLGLGDTITAKPIPLSRMCDLLTPDR